MSQNQVLNPDLYARLVRVFGRVDVHNRGEGMTGYHFRDVLDGRTKFRKTRHGEAYGLNCFAGETMVVTPAGDVPIRDLVGESLLLIPNKVGLGLWRKVEVRSFGSQKLLTVGLRRRQTKKAIRVTPDHRWIVSRAGGKQMEATTAQLLPGDKLAMCFGRSLSSYGSQAIHLSGVGVAQGFAFGDGSHQSGKRTPTTIRIYTKEKREGLSPYFSNCRITYPKHARGDVCQIHDLPRVWKRLPAAVESLSFLLGWFAGYFAADGSVSANGAQATLYSAKPAHLQFVKGICYQLGIRVSPIRFRKRKSGGCVPNAKDFPLYGMSFPVRDMPAEFWLLSHHRSRVDKWRAKATETQKSYWTISEVTDPGQTEEVFCAVVPGVEKFTLADNILTRNCPFCGDTERKLYINHMYGREGIAGLHGRTQASCFRRNCLKDHTRRHLLWQMIGEPLGERLANFEMVQPAAPDPWQIKDDVHAPLPGEVTLLSDLPEGHRAREYIRTRSNGYGHNVDFLSRYYGLGYCSSTTVEKFGPAVNRIFIPVFLGEYLRCWQMRSMDDNHKLKYFALPDGNIKRFLYGLDLARSFPWCVVVEGAPACWRMGPPTVGLFGSSIGEDQLRWLETLWPHGVVILPDVDFYEGDTYEAKRKNGMAEEKRNLLIKKIQSRLPNSFALSVPPNTDPENYAFRDLWNWILSETKARGWPELTPPYLHESVSPLLVP